MELLHKTIRSEFLSYINENKILIYHFAEKSGINSGTLSRVIHGSQPFSVKILDIITEHMGHDEGFFYDQYVDELFNDSSMNWRRLRPFMMRCSELGKNDCVERTVDMMMENAAYVKPLFEFAELLNDEGRVATALMIYRKVCEAERYQHAERLAICQYRIFKLSINDDQQNNLECAVQFEPFVARLNEVDQLDALKDLTNTFLSLRRWDKASKVAEEMGRLARIQYEMKHKRIRMGKSYNEPAKPLFGYILYANLILGSIAEEKDDYQQALYHVSCYENHDWIKENDTAAEKTKSQFREWAKANKYLYQLVSGEVHILGEYVEYLAARENEILRGLFKIMKSALTYNLNVDHVLERFQDTITCYIQERVTIGSYTDQIMGDRFVHFLADVGDYYLNTDRTHVGIQYVLNSLAISANIKNERCMLRCICAFDPIRHLATEDELHQYTTLLREVRNTK